MKNKKTIKKAALSSIITLIPAIVAIIVHLFYKEDIITKVGKILYESSLPFFIIFPLSFGVINFLCIVLTEKYQKNSQNDKLMAIVYSICPFISFFSSSIILFNMLDLRIDAFSFMMISFGLLFAIIGNYLPKCKQNKALGIKISFTLKNEENWNATHRFTGKLWFFGGIFLIAISLLPTVLKVYLLFATMILMVALPVAYSYSYYKKQVKNETWQEDKKITYSKKTLAFTSSLVAIILGVIMIISLTAEIKTEISPEALIIDADYWIDATIEYDEIENIEYTSNVRGTKVSGFSTHRILMGNFQNEKYGVYIRYTYAQNPYSVIITTKNETFVINAKTEEETKTLYNTLFEKTK